MTRPPFWTIPLLFASLSAGCAQPTAPASIPIYKTDTPVSIDGMLDDPCWTQAVPICVDYLYGQRGKLASSPRMVVKYAWDEHYLYIAYETFGRNLRAKNEKTVKGPPANQRPIAMNFDPNGKLDVTEFFISFGDCHLFWELHHNALNGFNDIWINAPAEDWPFSHSDMTNGANLYMIPEAYVKDDGADTLKMAVRLKPKADGTPSTINDANDVDTGYTAEIRLPWRGIGAPREWRLWFLREAPWQKEPERMPGPWAYIAGGEVAILAVCQSGDMEQRYTHSSPIAEFRSFFHKQAAEFPRYTLIDATAPTAQPPKFAVTRPSPR